MRYSELSLGIWAESNVQLGRSTVKQVDFAGIQVLCRFQLKRRLATDDFSSESTI